MCYPGDLGGDGNTGFTLGVGVSRGIPEIAFVLAPETVFLNADGNLGCHPEDATQTSGTKVVRALGTEYGFQFAVCSAEQRTRILREMTYFHLLYTLDAVRAQVRWREISGRNRTHFCGAYWFYGFHEEGMNSAIRVAETLGVVWDEPREAAA